MGLDRDTVKKRVIRALNVLEINELKDKAPHHLSGGENGLEKPHSLVFHAGEHRHQ